MSDLLNLLLWVVYPYISITIFLTGHVYTYTLRRYYWSARSTELLEKRMQSWSSYLFHYGIIIVLIGHIIGIAIPTAILLVLGISLTLHTELAFYLGGIFGTITLIGIIGLITRYLTNPRVRATLRFTDYLVYIILIVTIVLGLYNTLVVHPDYETTVGPWLQGLLSLHPNPNFMNDVPLLLKVHIAVSMLLYIIWPFSRLVHVWSFPVTYLWRPYIIYRSPLVKIRQLKDKQW